MTILCFLCRILIDFGCSESNCNPIVGLDSHSIGTFIQARYSSPTLELELGAYVRSRVVECMVTKSCGAHVQQGFTCDDYSNPLCLVPSFNASCSKCVDITSQAVCETNVLSCWWKDGKCVKTNCPHLFEYQYDKFKKTGITIDEYIEITGAKEAEPITKRVCRNQGCVYAPSIYWCSAWSTWTLVLSIAAWVLFIIVVVAVIVILCICFLKSSGNQGKDGSDGESLRVSMNEL